MEENTMENNFLTPEVVANEALMCLTGNLVMADLVHRDYADEFVSVGDTIKVMSLGVDEKGRLNLSRKDALNA